MLCKMLTHSRKKKEGGKSLQIFIFYLGLENET